MGTAPIPVETLLAHRAWVQAVARAVVRDPNAAADVEQEAWLEALHAPPREASSLRGWFGAVVRNRARRMGRGEARRRARETASVRTGAAASAADLAEIADTHRRVVQAVVELAEPYRQTILLRYFEGLGVGDVAARTGVALDTARSRISRGLAQLRERLARELGRDERPWHAALVPLIGEMRDSVIGAGWGAATGATTAGGTTMAAAWMCASALVVAGLGALALTRSAADAVEPKVVAAAAAPVFVPVPAPLPADDDPKDQPPAGKPPEPAPKSDAAKPAEPAPVQDPAEALAKSRLSIDLSDESYLDALGILAEETGVDIVVAQEAADLVAAKPSTVPVILKDADGLLALKTLAKLRALACAFEGERVVLVPSGVTRDASKPVVVPPKPKAQLSVTVLGQVTDASGVAVAGAEIVRTVDERRVLARSDLAGRYEAKVRPRRLVELQARLAGQVPSLAVTVQGEPGAQVTLDLALRGPAGRVHVTVTSESGPLAGATVTFIGPRGEWPRKVPDGETAKLWARFATTDANGEATFDGIPPGDASVTVRLAGYADAPTQADVKAGQIAEVSVRLLRQPSLEERLRTVKTSINLQETRLSDALGYLGRISGITFVVAPSAAEKVADKPITLTMEVASLTEVLTEICRVLGGVKFEVDEKESVVWIKLSDK